VSAAVEGARVLARIAASRFFDRPKEYRDEVCAWLRANGINPNAVTVRRDVEVVLLDAPAIVREEWVLDSERRTQLDPARPDQCLGRVVHSLLRVPLPDHLADPL
jgi:hypothetical protein